jgi:hypothetical protein
MVHNPGFRFLDGDWNGMGGGVKSAVEKKSAFQGTGTI